MLELSANSTMFDTFMYGLKVTLLGIGTVFAVLFILWLILTVFSIIFKAKSGAKETSVLQPVQAAAPVSSLKSQPVIVAEEDESELVAVIMATVYAASGATPGSLRIVSYKRQKTPWNRK